MGSMEDIGNVSEISRSDELLCTVCYQDLSSGAFRLEEHPTVPGVAVCPGCLATLRRELKKKRRGKGRAGEAEDEDGRVDEEDEDDDEDDHIDGGGKADEDLCAWCAESEDKTLFLCDGDACGRAFCDSCLDKLGEGTAAKLEASAEETKWMCPCCDESVLAPLQAPFLNAEKNPPLVSRVLARLAKDNEAAAAATAAAAAAATAPVAAAPPASIPPTRNGGNGGGDGKESAAVGLGEPSGRGSSTGTSTGTGTGGDGRAGNELPLSRKDGATVSVVASAEAAAGGGGVAGLGSLCSKSPSPPRREDDVFAQELIDAAVVVERDISNTLGQMDYAEVEERRKNITEELREGNPGMTEQQLRAEVSGEMKTVQDMWQQRLDALLDVQPTLKEALADRGLSETGVFVEAARGAEMASGGENGKGDESDVDSMDVDDDGDDDDDTDGGGMEGTAGGILEHYSKAAAGAGLAHDPVSDLLSKCKQAWEQLLRRKVDLVQDIGAEGAAGVDGADAGAGVDAIDRGMTLDAAFFKGAMEDVNDVPGPGKWGRNRIAAAAERAAAFFREEQTGDVVRGPSTEDVLAWGLKGERASQLGIFVRWITTRIATHLRENEALSRLDGDEDQDEEPQPPTDRQMLVSECKDLERQIKSVYAAWKGSAAEDFWSSAADEELRSAWHRLRQQRRSELANADSAVAVQAAGVGKLDAAAFQVEDLGTCTDAYLRISRGKRGYSAAKATRMLAEAMASEGGLAVQGRTEAEDSAAVNKERRKAVSRGSKPRRSRAPRAPRKPRAPKSQKAPKSGGGGGSGGLNGGRKSKASSRSAGREAVDGGGAVDGATGDGRGRSGAISIGSPAAAGNGGVIAKGKGKGKGKGKAPGGGDADGAAAAGVEPGRSDVDDDDDFIDDSGLLPEPAPKPKPVPEPLPQAVSPAVAGSQRECDGNRPSSAAAGGSASAPASCGKEQRK
ncbi:unnamed protein product, partial [Scytosiphon promiscuus]